MRKALAALFSLLAPLAVLAPSLVIAMSASQIPTKFPIPWGNSAGGSFIRTIPTLSQIGIQNCAASLTDGFPPLTFTPATGGGCPPFGQDFNGIFKQVTQWSQWYSAGAPLPFDSSFSSSIGGYPKGAQVGDCSTFGLYWVSTADNNTSNPCTGGANWTSFSLLSATGVTAGTYLAPSIVVGADGRITSATNGSAAFQQPANLGLSSSAGSSALTITLTTASGAAPSATSPVLAQFRSVSALSTGSQLAVAITASLSITIPSGATLGTGNSAPFRVWVFLTYNNGSPQLAVANCSSGLTIFPCTGWEFSLKTPVAVSAGATSAGVLYSAGGTVSLDAVRIIGYCEYNSGLTTAGVWASTCTNLQVAMPGIRRPGDVLQFTQTSTVSVTGCSTTPTQTAVSNSIQMMSRANFVRITAVNTAPTPPANGTLQLQLSRGSGPTPIGQAAVIGATTTGGGSTTGLAGSLLTWIDLPGTSSPSYAVFCTTNTSTGNAGGGSMLLEEIMGALEPANDDWPAREVG